MSYAHHFYIGQPQYGYAHKQQALLTVHELYKLPRTSFTFKNRQRIMFHDKFQVETNANCKLGDHNFYPKKPVLILSEKKAHFT